MILCKDCACEVKIEAWDVYKNNKIPLCFQCQKVRFQYYETIEKNNRAKIVQEQSRLKAERIRQAQERRKEREEAKQAEEAKQRLARKKYLEELIEKDKELLELFPYSKNSTTQQ